MRLRSRLSSVDCASTEPRYPSNALVPHGQDVGLQMGEKAEADAYMPGFLRKSVSAPWPPIEWPEMEALPESCVGNVAASTW